MGVLRNTWGRNTAVTAWVDGAVILYKLTGYAAKLLYFIATNTCFKLWRRFFMHIDAIREALGCSRSSVDKALKVLRDLKLIAYDGQVHVGRGRPVVVYRLSGTPECPLPEWVVQAREEARETSMALLEEDALTCDFTYRTKQAGPTVYATPKGDTPDTPDISPTAGVSIYRPAVPVKTRPQAGPQPWGPVRRGPHLRWLRSVAESLVAARGTGTAPGPVEGRQRGFQGVGDSLVTVRDTAVTYCHPPTRGATVQPFINPVFGNLSRDTRLLYLGLREAQTRGEHTYSDTLFLKSQFFPYDHDIDAPYLQSLVDALVAAGKIHIVDDGIELSDPPSNNQNIALFENPKKFVTATVRRRTKITEDPWFAAFWDNYPRRTGKGAARKAFAAAVAAGADPAVITTTASAYADRCALLQKEPQFIPHPATWLNQERWDDDEEQAPRVRSKVDDALRSGMDLVNFYQQQEAIPFEAPKELGW